MRLATPLGRAIRSRVSVRHAGLGFIVKSQESFDAYACVDAFNFDTRLRGWLLRAWNSHDLDAIMEHYANDVIFASPVATQQFLRVTA